MPIEKTDAKRTQYSLEQLLTGIENDFVVFQNNREVEFIIEVDEDLAVSYYGDENRVSRILWILIRNAYKYTLEGLIYLRLKREQVENEEYIIFEVSDTGLGIPEASLDTVIESGEKLSSVNTLLKLMGSELEVKSVRGIGSKFSFAIKAIEADSKRIVWASRDKVDSSTEGSDRKAAISDIKENDDSLPTVEGIDWNKAYERVPDVNLMHMVIREFYTKANNEIGALKLFGEAQNIVDYKIKVHSMKNSLALIGAEQASEMARLLEFAARDEDVEYIRNNHQDLIAEYLRIAETLANAYGESLSEISTKSIAKTELLDKLDELEKAMKVFDIETMNTIMEELEEYKFDGELDSAMSKLSESVLALDEQLFYEAIETLRA